MKKGRILFIVQNPTEEKIELCKMVAEKESLLISEFWNFFEEISSEKMRVIKRYARKKGNSAVGFVIDKPDSIRKKNRQSFVFLLY